MPSQSTEPVPPHQPPPRQRWLVPVAALLLTLALSAWYRSRPVAVMTDSLYSLLVAERLLHGKGPGLDDVLGPEPWLLDQPPWPYQAEPGYNRVLQIHHPPTPTGKVTLWYPHAPALLAAPWLAVRQLFGPATVFHRTGGYSIEREQALQHELASDVSAAAAAVLFVLAGLWLPWWQAWLLAAMLGLASPLLSTASRTLWNQTWGVLIGSILLLLVCRSDKVRRPLPVFWTATCMAWLYFCRPALITQVAVTGMYLLWRDWRVALRVTAVGLGWGALWLAWNHWQLTEALPNYYQHAKLGTDSWLLALQGVLISPSRGLFVYVPWLLPVLVVVWVQYRKHADQTLVLLGTCGVSLHVILVALYGNWWGGHSYGPRLLLDALPMMGLLAVLAVATLPSLAVVPRRLAQALLLLTALFGGFVHHRGATERATFRWNVTPRPIDEDTQRIFDWSQAQFLTGLVRWPLPAQLMPLPDDGQLHVGLNAAGPYLLEGWGQPEGAYRWTDGHSARLAWDEAGTATMQLEMRFHVFQLPAQAGAAKGQRLRIRVRAGQNGPVLAERSARIASGEWQTWQLRLAPAPPGPRVMELETPDAVAPVDVLGKGDERALGVALAHVRRVGPTARP